MLQALTPKILLPLILLLWVTGAYAEQYESCLTHPSETYLNIFKSELDKHNIAHVDVVTDGHVAVCVLPSDEAAVMKISVELANNKM